MTDDNHEYERSRNFCTTREAANRLGIALRTAQVWVDNGILEAWKTDGGHRRISLASVERLVRRMEESPPPPIVVSGVEQNAGNRLRVLVVEDDNVLLKLYRMRIAGWNLPIDITTASNGCEGLILIGREQPDLMISDLRMPGIDGYQMIRTLTASPFREGMEIVIVRVCRKNRSQTTVDCQQEFNCCQSRFPSMNSA